LLNFANFGVICAQFGREDRQTHIQRGDSLGKDFYPLAVAGRRAGWRRSGGVTGTRRGDAIGRLGARIRRVSPCPVRRYGGEEGYCGAYSPAKRVKTNREHV